MRTNIRVLALACSLLLLSAPELFSQVTWTRIKFARGSTSSSVSSTIPGNRQRKFVLKARYGQTLTATISSRNGCVVLGNQETSTTYETDQGDNVVDVFNNCGGATRFTLTVSIN